MTREEDNNNERSKTASPKRGRGRPKGSGVRKKVIPRDPNKKENRGGSRIGAGRPKGSKNIRSQESVKKLEELKFDPITEMVSMVEQIDKDLEKTYFDEKLQKDIPCIRLGSGAYAQIMTTRATLVNNLIKFGYRVVAEKVITEDVTVKPMEINFSFGKKPETTIIEED